jgi:hypothetical protein
MLKVKIYFGKVVFEGVNGVAFTLDTTVFCEQVEPVSTIEIKISWAAEWSNIQDVFIYYLFLLPHCLVPVIDF